MDGNKDESERCIDIAQNHMNNGDMQKALKFLYKANRLYPTQKASDLIVLLESLSEGASRKSSSFQQQFAGKATTESTDSKNEPNSENTKTSDVATKKDYTDEQLEAVTKIKKCKDFYAILGVPRDVNESNLKKQYKKLALQFHPDKNKAPGASEAFKVIGNAFTVLSDPEKRKRYDMYGIQDNRSSGRSANHHHYDYHSAGYESDISAEELFNMFFNGGFPSTAYQRRPNRRYSNQEASRTHQHRHNVSQEGHTNLTVIMQILPLIFFVCLSLLSSFFISDPVYSLLKTQKYPYERKTSNLKVPYFVKENFVSEYQGSIRRLEAQVEEDYIANLRSGCFKEKSYREGMIWRARNFRDRVLEEKAREIKTPSCDLLNELYKERSWAS